MTSAVQTLSRVRAAANPFGAAPEAVAEYNKAKEELNALARANWDDPAFHRQVAADISEVVDYGFSYESLFGTYLNIELVGEFDRVTIRERRGLKVFYTSRGGYIEESQLRNEEWELPRDTMGFHVSEHIDKLRANFADTIETLVGLGGQRMEAEVHRRVLTLAQTAIPSGSAYYVNPAGMVAADLSLAIRQVRDAIKPDGSGPVPITVLGRSTMTDKIADFDHGFDPEAKQEIREKGRLGTYKGANVVTLHNYQDEDGVAYIPANELWVLGGNFGKFALYGGLQVKGWDENTVDYRHYRARKDIGGLVHHPEQVRRIVDSTVTP